MLKNIVIYLFIVLCTNIIISCGKKGDLIQTIPPEKQQTIEKS